MMANDKYNHDLVTEDYYAKELEYQKDIDKLNNAKTLEKNIIVNKTKQGLEIIFPDNLDVKKIKGKVFLYRPSNKKLDFEIPISLSKPILLIPDKHLLDGHWNISIDWQYNENLYLFKDTFVY